MYHVRIYSLLQEMLENKITVLLCLRPVDFNCDVFSTKSCHSEL